MKKLTFAALLLTFFATASLAQVVTTEPAIIQQGYTGKIVITFDPNQGNKGMVGATSCYAHTGACTATKEWQCAPEWRSGLAKHKLTSVSGKWQLTIDNMYNYYDCLGGEEITKLAFVFNDGVGGSKEGKDVGNADIFVPVIKAGLGVAINTAMPPIASIGTSVTLNCSATAEADLTLKRNGETVKSVHGTSLNYTTTLSTAGDFVFEFEAKSGTETATAKVATCVAISAQTEARPTGISNGIYYSSNPTEVTLCTYAASKTDPAKHVFVVGDFNNWTVSNDYQMKRDGNYFWLKINGLTPQKEYAFQYYVVRSDGKLVKISDLYSEKLLHGDDKWEPTTVDPNIMTYPKEADGSYVSVIQTTKPKYAWSDATLNFKRPNKDNLVIYEMWVYDFTPERSFNGVLKSLDYLENLGINAIELMPVCEFDGNYNWGYSPNHYFAPDRAYGSENDLKTLIDECHKRGIAVIIDMVFNHATGLNPMNKLYPYGTELASNPWFNAKAPHGDNVYEDWNHDFEPAREMFQRSLKYWIQEYKVDGYRMDLAHGFCGSSNCSSLQANLESYQNAIKSVAPDAYFILEYWGSSPTQGTLVNKGMMCWGGGSGNSNAYCQTAMGWLKDGDSFQNNGDGYITYCESHDEERNFYKAKEWGNGSIKSNETVRLNRVPLNMAFNILLDGPHMIWQWNELGYDFAINSSIDNSEIKEDNRCSKKAQPIGMGWLKNSLRMAQYQKVAQLIQLRTKLMKNVFEGDATAASVSSGKALRTIQWGSNVFVAGNFHASENQNITLPSGTWYDYLAGATSTTSGNVTLNPGELKIYTNQKLTLPIIPASYDFGFPDALPTLEATSNNFIYPTVADNTIYIVSDNEPRRVEIVSIDGSRIANYNSETSEVNVSGLSRGLYLMVVTYDNAQEAFKFVKK